MAAKSVLQELDQLRSMLRDPLGLPATAAVLSSPSSAAYSMPARPYTAEVCTNAQREQQRQSAMPQARLQPHCRHHRVCVMQSNWLHSCVVTVHLLTQIIAYTQQQTVVRSNNSAVYADCPFDCLHKWLCHVACPANDCRRVWTGWAEPLRQQRRKWRQHCTGAA
jgi:hypothetical protein